jgi:hypothetical protein
MKHLLVMGALLGIATWGSRPLAAQSSCTTASISPGNTRTCPVTISGANATGFVAGTLLEMTITPSTWSVTPTLANLNS